MSASALPLRSAVPEASAPDRTVILLGPQGRRPTLSAALRDSGIDGRVAVVTAGWQEREAEVERLEAHLERHAENLRLHRRADEAFAEDPDLEKQHRERQAKLRRLQRLYNVRVEHAMAAVAELARRRGRNSLVEEEWAAAVADVARLDAEHLAKIDDIHRSYDDRLGLEGRKVLARHREEIGELLAEAAVLAIAGGHVAVLLNRLRLFGLAELAGDLPVVAWSGGAMVASERVVLYHDSPPQGAGNPEVLERGLGLVRGVVPLPHADVRLRLDDPDRVARFARRFAPDRCIAMGDGARLAVGPSGWSVTPETRVLGEDGRVERMEAS